MVFRGNSGGIDCQLTVNEEGGSYGFQWEQRGIDRQLTINEEGGHKNISAP